MKNPDSGFSPESHGLRDLSDAFLTMDRSEFGSFVTSLEKNTKLTITIDWTNVQDARYLKAFLQMSPRGQKRTAAIRATCEQKMLEPNVFSSGVEWIEVS